MPLGAVASRGPQVRPRMRGSTHWPGMSGESIGGWATMGAAPCPHYVSRIWTMPLTMRMAPRSSKSWSKIPTAVPTAQFLLNQNNPSEEGLRAVFRADVAGEPGRWPARA